MKPPKGTRPRSFAASPCVRYRLPGKGADTYSYYREGYEADPVHDPNAPRTSEKRCRILRSS